MNTLIIILFLHILWTACLYTLLSLFRAPKVWVLGKQYQNTFKQWETRTSANLSNQFEWPMFFYSLCVILILTPNMMNHFYLVTAWIFLIGRLLHSLVQILTNNIRLRGLIFSINFLVVLAMWCHFIKDVI